ncbi:MAG: hypothetical protein ACFFF4_05330 [Candidatus Thorarchaeota archaeon]
MQGKYILLMLAHLFRKCGEQVELAESVYRLAFVWRYGAPTNIRRLLTIAREKQLISYENGYIKAEFVYTVQKLDPNQSDIVSNEIMSNQNIEPLY